MDHIKRNNGTTGQSVYGTYFNPLFSMSESEIPWYTSVSLYTGSEVFFKEVVRFLVA